jgi:two-component system, NtrC family, nitrogen regulation response regulator NtrX
MATLLYVDDEEVIGMVVSKFFAMRGDVVHLARTAAEAREAIVRHAPDVIFLDVWLGPDNGADVMDWIVEHHPALASRVTFVTGEHATPSRIPPKWETFGRPVIYKPFDLMALAQTLQQAGNSYGT